MSLTPRTIKKDITERLLVLNKRLQAASAINFGITNTFTRKHAPCNIDLSKVQKITDSPLPTSKVQDSHQRNSSSSQHQENNAHENEFHSINDDIEIRELLKEFNMQAIDDGKEPADLGDSEFEAWLKKRKRKSKKIKKSIDKTAIIFKKIIPTFFRNKAIETSKVNVQSSSSTQKSIHDFISSTLKNEAPNVHDIQKSNRLKSNAQEAKKKAASR